MSWAMAAGMADEMVFAVPACYSLLILFHSRFDPTYKHGVESSTREGTIGTSKFLGLGKKTLIVGLDSGSRSIRLGGSIVEALIDSRGRRKRRRDGEKDGGTHGSSWVIEDRKEKSGSIKGARIVRAIVRKN